MKKGKAGKSASESGDRLLNREDGDGAGSSAKQEAGDAGKQGYHRESFSGDDAENYRIADGYQSKDESPARTEGTNVQMIAKHSVTGELYSGHPERHGHMGKVYGSSPADGGSDKARSGGGGGKESM